MCEELAKVSKKCAHNAEKLMKTLFGFVITKSNASIEILNHLIAANSLLIGI